MTAPASNSDALADIDPDVLRDEPAVDDDRQRKADYAFGRWRAQEGRYGALIRLWTRVIIFLLGRQWLDWDDGARRYVQTSVPAWKQQPVTNLVFAVYRSAIAKLTKQRPTWEVVPPSRDGDDRQSANLGEALLQQVWRSHGFSKLFGKAAGWILAAGKVYVRMYWDAEAGKLIDATVPVPHPDPELAAAGQEVDCACDENGEPYAGPDGTPDLMRQPDRVFEGEIGKELLSPLNVRLNPDCEDEEEAEEYYIGRLWPVAKAARVFGVPVDGLMEGGEDDLAYAFDSITAASARADILGAATSMGSATGDRGDEIGPRCLVLEYYRKPCNDYMEGRHWIQVNRTIVWPREDDDEHPDGEAPLPEGFWPPVVGFGDTPIPGTTHEMGLLQPVVSLNREYNTVNAKIEEHNIMMAMGGKWIMSSADQGLKINTDPGQKLVSKGYDQGKPPIQAAMSALPAPVYAERERIISDVMLVASQNEIAMGKKPEGVSSGRGFLVLQEAVDSVLSPLLMGMEDAFAELGRRVLVLASRHYAVERLVRIRGNQGQWEVRSFKGADLGDSIDVQVQIGSMFPWSKSAKQDMVLSVLQALPGLVTDPATGAVDQAKVARYLDQGGIRAFEAEGNPDLIEVELEHGQFEDGQQVQIGFWQNHAAHLAAHAEFLKTERARFEKWPPRQQQAFLTHMQQTQMVLEAQVQRLSAPPEPTPGGAADPAGGPAAGIAADGPTSDLQLTAGDRASAEPGGGA